MVINLSLYDHVEEGAALVDTQIPDKRSAQLYVVSELALYPDIKSVLYVSDYFLFELGDQLYLIISLYGEITRYDVYEVNGVHFKQVVEFGIACC